MILVKNDSKKEEKGERERFTGLLFGCHTNLQGCCSKLSADCIEGCHELMGMNSQ